MLDYIGQNKIAARWLIEYPERRRIYLDKMQDFTTLSATRYSGMPTGTDPGHPCEDKAISLAEIEDQKQWLMVVEDTEKTLGEKKRALLSIRRQAEVIKHDGSQPEGGRPPWMSYTQVKYAEWHERRFGTYYEPSRKTVFNWWDETINIAVRIAIKRGCL